MTRKQTPLFLIKENIAGVRKREFVTTQYIPDMELTEDTYTICSPLNRAAIRYAMKKLDSPRSKKAGTRLLLTKKMLHDHIAKANKRRDNLIRRQKRYYKKLLIENMGVLPENVLGGIK